MYRLLFSPRLLPHGPRGRAPPRVPGHPDAADARLRPPRRALHAPDPSLAVETLGLRFPSPFGVAAGFDKDGLAVRGLGQLGFGHVEVGTITAVAQPGNDAPAPVPAHRATARSSTAWASTTAGRMPRSAASRGCRVVGDRPVLGVNIGKSRVTRRRGRRRRLRAQRRACSRRTPTTSWSTSARRTRPASAACRSSTRSRRCSRRCAPRPATHAAPREDRARPRRRRDRAHLRARRPRSASTASSRRTRRSPARGSERRHPSSRRIGAGGLSGAPLAARSLEVLATRPRERARRALRHLGRRRRDRRRRAGPPRRRRDARAGLLGVHLPRPALGAAGQPRARRHPAGAREPRHRGRHGRRRHAGPTQPSDGSEQADLARADRRSSSRRSPTPTAPRRRAARPCVRPPASTASPVERRRIATAATLVGVLGGELARRAPRRAGRRRR